MVKLDDNIKIYDGYDDTASILADLQEIPDNTLTSTTNVVYIVCSRLAELKFNLEWTQVGRDTNTNIENGTKTVNCTSNSLVYVDTLDQINISSPGYPYGYDTGLSCSWTFIPVNMGFHISLVLHSIDLEDVDSCVADYVTISASENMKDYTTLAKLCQPNNTHTFNGTPYMKLDFISDYYANRTGFDSYVMLGCGGLLNGPNGAITTAMTIPNNVIDQACEWKITVGIGRTIKFEFDELNLPKDTYSGACEGFVLIRNGENDEAPFLGSGKFCGTDKPTIEATTSNKAFVRFYHGPRKYVESLNLRYKEVAFDCGGSIILSSNYNKTTINSPNYPNIPNAHIECIWVITAPNGESIRIDFLERFDLTITNPCDQEYVELRDGGTINAGEIGTFCNNTPGTQFSSTNMLRIKYYTNVVVPKNGFKSEVSIDKCGGFYRGNRFGAVKSKNYPGLGAYPSNSVCEYRVQGQPGSVLTMKFVDLNLPSTLTNCTDVDHITIYNIIPDGNGTLDEITTLCGDVLPDDIIADGFEILIKFVTLQQNTKYRGFHVTYNTSIESCDAKITAESAVITSPGYPKGNQFRRFCEWKITVPKGRRIKLDVIDLDMSYGDGQLNVRLMRPIKSRIAFYNDHTYVSRIKTITGSDAPQSIYSSDNKMLISMWLMKNVGHRGFKFSFSSDELTICNGNLNGNEGTFLSPDNESAFYCEYIRRDSSLVADRYGFGTLAIHLTDIAKENRTVPCISGVVFGVSVIYDQNSNVKHVNRKCGENSNFYNTIASPFPSTKVIIKQSTFIRNPNQYRVQYKIHQCGGLIENNMTFTIKQTNFSYNYGEVDCAWQYKTIEGLKVQMNFSHLKMECDKEYINIYNGLYSTSPKLLQICGEAVNKSSVILNGHNLFVEYHSDSYSAQSKFELKISSSYALCGGVIEEPLYQFQNPVNGTQYSNGAECIWNIKAQIGYHIGLEFVNRFFLEDSTNCTKDYIEGFDLIEMEWKSLGRVCGRSTPKPFNSTGNQMKVVFRTNNNITGDGFVAQWQRNCGGIFTATENIQEITSPRYPNTYPPNIFCNYTIVADDDSLINIKFVDFELEDTTRACQYDNLTIYKYQEYSMPSTQVQVGVYCWKNSLNTLRYKHKINIIFRSDTWVEKRGFKFEYNLDICGGVIKNSTSIGVPKSPETNKYSEQMNCYWNITAPLDKKIVIRFEMFDLEANDQCYLDRVEVFEGAKPVPENRKALLCGNLTLHAPVINILSNKAIIKFYSDISNNGEGFTALVLFVPSCDKKIELTKNSPTYNLDEFSNGYAEHLDCHYTITVPEGNIISLTFTNFHIAPCNESQKACNCDFVEVRDGAGPFAELIRDRFCGHIIPNSILSSGVAVWIRFVTDSIISSNGFNATLKLEESVCGVTHIMLNDSSPEKAIYSPGSPKYPSNTRCEWIIEAPSDENINLYFERFDLQADNESGLCNNDYLEILDDDINHIITEGLGSETVFAGKKSKVLNPYFYSGKHFAVAPHLYCGSAIPNEFYSSSNKLYMRFRSDAEIQQSGFKVTAKLLKACHRNFTSSQGRIFSRKNEDCETHITAPENNTISLYFTEFSFYSTDSTCSEKNTPIQVYEGQPNNQLIASLCASTKPGPIFSNTSSVIIKFKKIDLSWTGSNGLYDITYAATDKGRGCGGQLFNYGGSFTSPLYPLNARNFADCRWDIAVPTNLKVALQFEIFDLGAKSTCQDNYLQIIEVDENGAEEIARQFCGEDNPSPYKGRRNILSVRFKKTLNFAGSGWIIAFMGVQDNSVLQSW